MTTTLSKDAERVSMIVDEIEDYNRSISEIEYQICDVPDDEREGDVDDLNDEQKRLQDKVNDLVNDLKDEDVEIEYDGKLTQVRRNGVLWLECYYGQGGYDWIEHTPVKLFPTIGASQLTLIQALGFDPEEERK